MSLRLATPITGHDPCKGCTKSFELQGIYGTDGQFHAKELLYRGLGNCEWLDVDRSSLEYLSKPLHLKDKLFVNLSNESLLHLPTEAFITASNANDIVFELSETFDSKYPFEDVSASVNELTRHGIQFAIDDFGAGRDGLNRLYALDRIAYIKLDGMFLKTCMKRKDAAAAMESLIDKWDSSGIKIIAEWIETQETLEFAASIGVHFVQGWFCDGKFGTSMENRLGKAVSMCPIFQSKATSFNSLCYEPIPLRQNRRF